MYMISSWDFTVILSADRAITLFWPGIDMARETEGLHLYAADVGVSIISDHKEQSERRLWLDENSSARLPTQTPVLNAMTSFTSAAHWDCFQVLLYLVIEQTRDTFEPKTILRHHWILQNSKWVDMTVWYYQSVYICGIVYQHNYIDIWFITLYHNR